MKVQRIIQIFVLTILSVMIFGACSKSTSESKSDSKNTGVVVVSFDELIKTVKKDESALVMLARKKDLEKTKADVILDQDAKTKGIKAYLFYWNEAPSDLSWNTQEVSKSRDQLKNIGITDGKSQYRVFKNGKVVEKTGSMFSEKSVLFETEEFYPEIKKAFNK